MKLNEKIRKALKYMKELGEDLKYPFLEFLREMLKFSAKAIIIIVVLFLGMKYILNKDISAPKNTKMYKLTNVVKVHKGNYSDMTLYVQKGDTVEAVEINTIYDAEVKYVLDAKEYMWVELVDCDKLDTRGRTYVDYAIIHIKSVEDIP